MNLSNMKKMNDKPLRRVQGFKFNGASWLSKPTPLNYTQDYCVIIKFRLRDISDSSFVALWGSNHKDMGQEAVVIGISMTNTVIQAQIGRNDVKSNPYHPISEGYGDIQVVAIRRKNNLGALMYNSIINEDATIITDGIYTPPYIGARASGGSDPTGISLYYNEIILEVLEIQDTLTDAQLLEFANLASFTDHSDYATFNKNAYYPLDYNTKDYSGNSNNGIVTGVEQYEIVERGIKSINGAEVLSKKGFKFNGGSFVNTGYSHMQPNNNTTIMLWIDPEINGSNAHVLSSRDSNVTTDYFWFLGVNSSKYFNYSAKYIFDINNVYVEQQITELTHVTVVFDSSQVYMYFNGVQQTTVDIINNTQFLQNIAPIRFGASDISDPTNYLTGTMQDIKIFNSALTEAQIKEEIKGNVLPALGYWPLQEDTKDYSSNSNNGTVTGTEQYETVQNGLTDWKDPVLS